MVRLRDMTHPEVKQAGKLYSAKPILQADSRIRKPAAVAQLLIIQLVDRLPFIPFLIDDVQFMILRNLDVHQVHRARVQVMVRQHQASLRPTRRKIDMVFNL
jgi:hypothetical protein